MVKTELVRIGNVIRSAKCTNGGYAFRKEFDSISQAKKESHDLQMGNGGLGQGYLRVESPKKKSKPKKKAYRPDAKVKKLTLVKK